MQHIWKAKYIACNIFERLYILQPIYLYIYIYIYILLNILHAIYLELYILQTHTDFMLQRPDFMIQRLYHKIWGCSIKWVWVCNIYSLANILSAIYIALQIYCLQYI